MASSPKERRALYSSSTEAEASLYMGAAFEEVAGWT